MSAPVGFGELEQLAAALKAGGVRQASTDPADLSLPGVWVQATGIDLDVSPGYTLHARLVLIVPDNGGPRRVLAALSALLREVLEVVDPTGTIAATTVTLPAGGARLPALSVPVDLILTPEGTP